MSDDPQTQKLRQKMTQLCPDMAKEILEMDKADLEQLLASASALQIQTKQSKNPNRQQMIAELARLFPETKKDIENLDYNDLLQVYANYQNSVESTKKNQNKIIKKKKVMENGELNVYEMKKILIDKLPQYRNDIRNLPDQQIKRMYYDLQSKSDPHQRQLRNSTVSYQSQISPQINEAIPKNSNLSIKPGLSNYNQEQNYPEDMAMGSDDLRKKGRPRKLRQYTGFNYEDVSNYGNFNGAKSVGKPYDFTADYPVSEYSSMNQFHQQSQSYLGNIYDTKEPKLVTNYESDYMNPTASVQKNQSASVIKNYNNLNSGMGSNASIKNNINNKALKQNQKIKITFYINQSDLEDEQDEQNEEQKKVNDSKDQAQTEQTGNEMQAEKQKTEKEPEMKKTKKIKKANKLANIIQKLQKVFGNKKCKIQ